MFRCICTFLASLTLLFALWAPPTFSQGQIGAGHVLGNPSASQRTPTDAPLSPVFDQAFCATTSATLIRSLTGWGCQTGVAIPTITGCSITQSRGNILAGTYRSGINGTCTATLAFPFAAPNGWVCSAYDTTTTTVTPHQTAFSTTSATILGTANLNDAIVFGCMPF